MKLLFENWREYLNEDVPQAGESSGTAHTAEPERTEEMTVGELLKLSYKVAYSDDMEEIDADPEHEDRTWPVYVKIKEYQNYFEQNPDLSRLPPLQVKGEWVVDGAHRFNALKLASRNNPELLNQTIKVDFFTRGLLWSRCWSRGKIKYETPI